MEEYVGRWVCQLTWFNVYRGGSVSDIRSDRNGLLDRWLVVCEFAVRSGPNDVRAAFLQSLLL